MLISRIDNGYYTLTNHLAGCLGAWSPFAWRVGFHHVLLYHGRPELGAVPYHRASSPDPTVWHELLVPDTEDLAESHSATMEAPQMTLWVPPPLLLPPKRPRVCWSHVWRPLAPSLL